MVNTILSVCTLILSLLNIIYVTKLYYRDCKTSIKDNKEITVEKQVITVVEEDKNEEKDKDNIKAYGSPHAYAKAILDGEVDILDELQK